MKEYRSSACPWFYREPVICSTRVCGVLAAHACVHRRRRGLFDFKGCLPEPAPAPAAGVIKETIGEGVDAAVNDNLQKCIAHLQSLGAVVEEVGGGSRRSQMCQGCCCAALAVPAHVTADKWAPCRVCAAACGALAASDAQQTQLTCCLLDLSATRVSDGVWRVCR